MRRAVGLGLACSAAAVLATAVAHAEVVQKAGVRVSAAASLSPKALPRRGAKPVSVSLSGRITAVAEGQLPQLRSVEIDINSHGVLRSDSVPRCPRRAIATSTNSGALVACRAALVGEGRFTADVRLPSQSPFPSSGRLLAFNGRFDGSPAILAHIYGTEPYPTSYVLPFLIRKSSGTYGTILDAELPEVTGEWGYVTGISMQLGKPGNPGTRGFLSAGCPAPEGFPAAVFPLARTTFSFAGGVNLRTVIERNCKAS